MKCLLDCDAVFDRLTRRPFPGGDADDVYVERHLQACHECRQLAEALRPAVALLHEAYSDSVESCEPLPVYRGILTATEESVTLNETAAKAKWTGSLAAGWSLFTSVVTIAVVVSALFAATERRSGDGRPPASASLLGGESGGTFTLASLNLSVVCLSSEKTGGAAAVRCCTDCHHAGPSSVRGIDLARLQLACVACHER